MHRHIVALIAFFFSSFAFSLQAQITLFQQSGNTTDTWNYTSTGADATAQAQVVNHLNYTSAPQSIVVGGNTGGGSCIDGGTGNGPSIARTFTFESVNISSSNQYTRTLSFNWGNRLPVCTGTGWDTGENLIFIPVIDGIEQAEQTLATGGNDAIFPIATNSFSYQISPCVNSFGFILYVTTNRRDELLFLDDVLLTAPAMNGPVVPTLEFLSVCQNELPLDWNGQSLNAAGTYTTTLLSSTGCDSLIQLNLSITESQFHTEKISLCASAAPLTLHGTSITESGEYPFTFPSSTSCDSTVTYIVTFFPEFSQTLNVTICQNELPYQWQGQVLNAGGTFTAALTSSLGCDSTLTLNLVVNPVPQANFTANPTAVTTDNPVVQFTNNVSDFDLIVWNFGDGTSSNSPSETHTFPAEPGNYQITMTVQLAGCSNSQTTTITITENTAAEFILTNVFSPNNDGMNDAFTNHVKNAQSMELVILNRWGNVVFQTDSADDTWSGDDQSTGLPCVEGTYFYKLRIIDKTNQEHMHNSFVQLVRK